MIDAVESPCMNYHSKRIALRNVEAPADLKPAYYDVWMHPGNRKALTHFQNDLAGRFRRHGAIVGSFPILVYLYYKLRRPFQRFQFPFLRMAVISSLIIANFFPYATTAFTKHIDKERALRHFLRSIDSFAAAKLRLALQDHYYLTKRQHPFPFPRFPHDKWDALVLTEHDADVAAGNFGDRHKWIKQERETYEKMTSLLDFKTVLQEQRELQEKEFIPSIYGATLHAPFLPKNGGTLEEKHTYNVALYTGFFQWIKENWYSHFGYGFYWEEFLKEESELKSRKWATYISNIHYYWRKWREKGKGEVVQ